MSGVLIFAIAGWVIGLSFGWVSVTEWFKDDKHWNDEFWLVVTLAAGLSLMVGMGATYIFFFPVSR